LLAKLAADPIYPPRLYVPQRMRTLSLLGQEDDESEDALAQVRGWLASPHGRFLVLLGDFGTGKTFLLHELALHLGQAEGIGEWQRRQSSAPVAQAERTRKRLDHS
jgi:ABC-type phosphate/phosphonate transport system ATPase subunit